jgi:hypothetical protein
MTKWTIFIDKVRSSWTCNVGDYIFCKMTEYFNGTWYKCLVFVLSQPPYDVTTILIVCEEAEIISRRQLQLHDPTCHSSSSYTKSSLISYLVTPHLAVHIVNEVWTRTQILQMHSLSLSARFSDLDPSFIAHLRIVL